MLLNACLRVGVVPLWKVVTVVVETVYFASLRVEY